MKRNLCRKHLMVAFFACLWLALLLAFPAGAATKKGFVESGGKYYYYQSDGTKAKGLTKIGKKYYYFDSKGVQRTSWRLVDGAYYYFYPANGSKGKMLKSKWVDGIYLNKNGRATGSSKELRKVQVMVMASEVVDSQTKPTMSKAKKRKTMFKYMLTAYGNVIIPDFTGDENWDVAYAQFLFKQGYGDCYAYAAAFAYFMNAIGYEGVWVEHSGNHAWVRWKTYYFDPHWGMTYGTMKTYYVSESLSGKNKLPNWKKIVISGREVDTLL